MAFNRLSLSEKLLTKTQPQGECLVWTGQRDPRGYGFLRLEGRLQRAHRLAYALHHGEIPTGAVIRHKCDNPACIKLAHLELGSQRDNIHDMIQRGRDNRLRGEQNPKARLTATQVAEIRARYHPGQRGSGCGALAKQFGVAKPTVRAIIRGKTWTGAA